MNIKRNNKENLNKEKLFKDTVPRSRVQLDIVKKITSAIKNMPADIPKKIIFYQDIIRENGEYFLLNKKAQNLQPLAKYLNKNSFNSKKLLVEFKEILSLLGKVDLIKEFFPEGINAANFWIDEKETVYLMPEVFLRAKRNYTDFDFEIPVKEYFMPPEIIDGGKWEQKSYIFNLAAVFYYFLSSKTIFNDQDNAKVLNKIQSEKILELKAIMPETSDSFNDILMGMLAKDLEKRKDFSDYSRKLDSLISDSKNNFKLEPFLERENLIENKIIKKKQRNENIKLFFRQSWKVLLFIAILGGGFIWGLGTGSPATITAEHSPEEVVNFFYEGVGTKNINLANEAVTFSLGRMERMISESHVIETMQQAYRDPNQEGDIQRVYSLEDLEVEEISASEERYQFRAFYEFNFRDQDGQFFNDVEDELILERIDGIWRITEIRGDFREMIAGDYPWRE